MTTWMFVMIIIFSIFYLISNNFFRSAPSQCGGAIITALSQTGSLYTPKTAYLPHVLLGEVSKPNSPSPPSHKL